jgi:hypothetical protein
MKKLFSILLLANPFLLFAQISLKGKLTDSKGESISYANIRIYDTVSGSQFLSITTKKDGSFQLNLPKIPIDIIITALGYRKLIKTIVASPENIIVHTWILDRDTVILKEVIVHSDRSIIINGDTISMSAKAFATGEEKVLEDLLKKIPGINVSEDGIIRIGNTEIEKIMVEGDDFFEKGYRLLSRNMPPNPIDRVEVIQNYVANTKLKGLEKSNKVVLNLKLDDKAKTKWFGETDLSVDVTEPNRHNTKVNLMRMGKLNKYFLLANANNIGVDLNLGLDDLYADVRGNGLAKSESIATEDPFLSIQLQQNRFDQNRSLFNNAKLFSFNSIQKLNKKVKLRINGVRHIDDQFFFKKSFEQFKVDQLEFENTEITELRKNIETNLLKVLLEFDQSDQSNFTYSASIRGFNITDISQIIFNIDSVNENLKTNQFNQFHNLRYTNRLTKNLAWITEASFIKTNIPQSYLVNNIPFSVIFPVNNIIAAKQLIDISTSNIQISSTLIKKFQDSSLFEANISYSSLKNSFRSTFLLVKGDSLLLPNTDYINNAQYQQYSYKILLKYRKRFKNLSLIPELLFNSNNQNLSQGNIQQLNKIFILPSLGIDWKISKKHTFIASYHFRVSSIPWNKLPDGQILEGYRSFTIGTGFPYQLPSRNFLLGYTFGNWSDQFFANLFFIKNTELEFEGSSSTIEKQFSITKTIIIPNRSFTSLSSSFDYFISPLNLNVKAKIGFSESEYKNYVNSLDLRFIRNNSFYYGVELKTLFKKWFNQHFGILFTSNIIKANSTSQDFLDIKLFNDFIFRFNKKTFIKAKIDGYQFGNMSNGSNRYFFVDVDLTQQLFKNKISVGLSAKNILNKQNFQYSNISDQGFMYTDFRLLPRFVMVEVSFRF